MGNFVDNLNVEGGLTASFIQADGSLLTNVSHSQLTDVNGGGNYHLTENEYNILSSGATSFNGTTVTGDNIGLVPDDGVAGIGTRVLADDGSWINIGGAKSMILSFAANGSPEIVTTSTTYVRLSTFIYAGIDNIGSINAIRANVWRDGGTSIDIRIVDLGTGSVIVEKNILAINSDNLEDLGTISNLPNLPSVMEIQMRKTGGGGAKALCAGIEIEY